MKHEGTQCEVCSCIANNTQTVTSVSSKFLSRSVKKCISHFKNRTSYHHHIYLVHFIFSNLSIHNFWYLPFQNTCLEPLNSESTNRDIIWKIYQIIRENLSEIIGNHEKASKIMQTYRKFMLFLEFDEKSTKFYKNKISNYWIKIMS